MHVANPDHLMTVWWPPASSFIFSSLCFPIPSPLFPIFAPVSHLSASWTMPGEQIWWPPLFSLWRRSLIASPPPSPPGQQWGTKRWEISPPAHPARCHLQYSHFDGRESNQAAKLDKKGLMALRGDQKLWRRRFRESKTVVGAEREPKTLKIRLIAKQQTQNRDDWNEIYSCVCCSNRKAHKYTACKFSSFTTVDFGSSLFSGVYLLPNPTTCLCQVFVCAPVLYLLSSYWMRFVLWLPSPHLDVLVSHKEGWGDRSTC